MEMNALMREILDILPNATFGEDNDGQVIIYTDLRIITSADNPTIAEGVELLVPFEEVP